MNPSVCLFRRVLSRIAAAFVLCAATLPVQAAMTVNSDGTVTDTTTGLVWDRCPYGLTGSACSNGSAVQVTWSNALKSSVAANAASYLGFSDWRVPNRNELESLVKIDAQYPAIDATAFPNTPFTTSQVDGWFWTSTRVAPSPTNAWHIHFGDGNTFSFSTTRTGYVRLVRSGQPLASFDLLAPPPTVPGAPVIGAATPGNAQASVSFTPPANNGGSVITGYKATSTPSGKTSIGCTASPCTVLGLTNGTTYTFTVNATNAVGDGPSSSPSNSVTPSALIPLSRLINLSTRGQVQTGSNVMIGGFIVGGSSPKSVLIRAVGPNLANFGVTGVLADPTLQVFSGSSLIAENNDWGTAANATAIQATGLAPANPRESAVLANLNPGPYTAIVAGLGGGTGVGIVEVYEIDNPGAAFTNISTRGQVQTGNDVMIGGFIIQGTSPQTVLIRAVGPNLANFGVTGVLANPTLTLYAGPNAIASNDDWGTSANAAAIQATGLAPASPLESAILISLPPGAYTAVVSGAGGGTGVGIVEVFAQ